MYLPTVQQVRTPAQAPNFSEPPEETKRTGPPVDGPTRTADRQPTHRQPTQQSPDSDEPEERRAKVRRSLNCTTHRVLWHRTEDGGGYLRWGQPHLLVVTANTANTAKTSAGGYGLKSLHNRPHMKNVKYKSITETIRSFFVLKSSGMFGAIVEAVMFFVVSP